MKRLQVVKCNPVVYRSLLFKFGSTSSKIFVYSIAPSAFVKRDSLLVFSMAATNSIRIVNKMILNQGSVVVSLNQFDSILFQFSSANNKLSLPRQLIWMIKLGLNYTINLESNRKSTFDKSVSRITPNWPSSLVTVKPYWQKRSDFVRSKFSRNFRYADITTGVSSDARLSRSYATKDVSVKFLSWKLKSVSSTVVKPAQLENSLVNWLNVIGWYSTYSAASQAIGRGLVLVNDFPVTDPQYVVQVGDALRVVPTGQNNDIILMIVNNLLPFAVVNTAFYSATVLQCLNQSGLQIAIFTQFNLNNLPVTFGNPLNSIFTTSRFLVNRIRK